MHPDVELVGTTWEVTGFISGAGPDAGVSSASGLDARVVLGEDGTVSGSDGCNEFGFAEAPTPDDREETVALRYTVDGDEITFDGDPVSTLRGCENIDVEPFWAVLDGTVTWEIESDRLTLTADDGRGVTFRAATG